MKSRIKDLIFEGLYLLPVIILNILIWTEIEEESNRKILLFLLSIPLSCCIGISAVNFIRKVIDFKRYFQTRDERRLTGLDVCPKCKGVGWVDWVEQITGKKEGRIRNEQSP
jgi:hypothetical protein